MKYGHYNFQSRLVLFFVHIHGNSASVILHDNRVVFANSYFNVCAISCKGLIDRVVNRFINKMVKTFLTNVANIHGGTFANCLKTFENLYVTRGITFFRQLLSFVHVFSIVNVDVISHKVNKKSRHLRAVRH